MTKTYITADGARFRARNDREFLQCLRRASWNPGDSYRRYRRSTAWAASLQTGRPHRADSSCLLVRDLENSGLVRIETAAPSYP